MKKFLVITFLSLLSVNICLSQNNIIQDKYSGIEMELSSDGNYLVITSLKTGSPADLMPFRVGDRIFMINEKYVNEITDCTDFFLSNNEDWMSMSIRKSGGDSSVINVPRVSVDLFSERYSTEARLFGMLSPYQYVGFSNNEYIENEKYDILEDLVQSSENPQAYYISGPVNDYLKFCSYSLKENISKHAQVTTLADDGKRLDEYSTYDFDFTSREDPLMEKTLLNDLEKQLIEIGLKRNTVSPDILIIISFYSGQKDQFVPPQQIVSTRIQNYFNWYWGYIPVPVTESKTKEGQTISTFLTNINVKFLDANDLSDSELPPVIWSSSYSEVSPEKTFLSDCSKEIFKYLLLQFPRVEKENCENLVINNYTFTGIIYDNDNLALIADVIPGSPAYEAGVKGGDAILKVNGRKIAEQLSEQDPSIMWDKRADTKNALRYIFINSDFRNGNPAIVDPLTANFNGYKNPASGPLIFEVRRGGKKMELSVKPEFNKVVFFEDKGFTVN